MIKLIKLLLCDAFFLLQFSLKWLEKIGLHKKLDFNDNIKELDIISDT